MHVLAQLSRATARRVAPFAACLALASLAFADTARADMLPAPPRDCPRGTIGVTSRAGVYCQPTRCDEGTSCPGEPHCAELGHPCPSPEPWRCEAEPRGLCVRTEMREIAFPPGIPDQRVELALGPCAQDGDCADGARCELERRCVHDPVPVATPAVPSPEPAPAPEPEPAQAPDAPDAPVEPRSSFCSAGTARASSGWAAAIAGSLALAWLARRRR